MNAYKHISIGNINLDIYVLVESIPGPDEDTTAKELYIGPGGAASNYAVAATRFGHESFLVGHLGARGLGAYLLDSLRKSGIRTDYVIIHHDRDPGIVVILVAPGGERAMATMRGANTLLRGDEAEGVESDILHIASREPEIVARATATINTRFVTYDPGGRVAKKYGPTLLGQIVDKVDLIAVNRVEADLVFGGKDPALIASKLSGRLRFVLLKKGGEGASLITREGVYNVEAYKEGEVIDTTGAGDVFIAVFNTYFIEGHSIEDALRAASIASGLKVQRRGAQSIPSREEVEERLRRGSVKVTYIKH
jgi:ribokinase